MVLDNSLPVLPMDGGYTSAFDGQAKIPRGSPLDALAEGGRCTPRDSSNIAKRGFDVLMKLRKSDKGDPIHKWMAPYKSVN